MRIPKRFKLLGHTVEVVDNDRLLSDRDWTGAACYAESRIELLPPSAQCPRSESQYAQTFFHELSHFLLYYAGAAINHKLGDELAHRNEEFVDLLGSLLHQAIATMEYDEPA